MPPLRTFTFINIYNKNISIVIRAYNYEDALDIKNLNVVCPNEYKLEL